MRMGKATITYIGTEEHPAWEYWNTKEPDIAWEIWDSYELEHELD